MTALLFGGTALLSQHNDNHHSSPGWQSNKTVSVYREGEGLQTKLSDE